MDSLYKVCRFCYVRLSPKDLPKKNLRQPPTNLVIDIDLRGEIIDLFKPKVFCCSCRSWLSDLDITLLVRRFFVSLQIDAIYAKYTRPP